MIEKRNSGPKEGQGSDSIRDTYYEGRYRLRSALRPMLVIHSVVCETLGQKFIRELFREEFNGSYPMWSEIYKDSGEYLIEISDNLTASQVINFIDSLERSFQIIKCNKQYKEEANKKFERAPQSLDNILSAVRSFLANLFRKRD